MRIVLDHEGLTFEKSNVYTTFYWATLLLTFFSSTHNKVFFTWFHYAAYRLAEWMDSRPVPYNHAESFTSGSLTYYHVTNTILNQESARGSDNFAVLLSTPELEEFLSLTKDYRTLDAGQANGLIVVLRASNHEKLAELVTALEKINAAILSIVYEGVELGDH